MRKTLFTLLLTMFHLYLFSQSTATLSGNVTDKQTNEPLIGATVTIKGTFVSVITDNQGNFRLSKISAGNLTLVISYVGYSTLELAVTINNEKVTVAAGLISDKGIGNEVVVSASKHAEKITNAPASIHIIGVKDFEQFAGSNVGELVSKIQGVEYTRNGITDITFNARGFHSAFNNKVLQLVDGRNCMAALSGSLPLNNRISATKEDLERFEIVLGPQSALYGPNALNAVFNYMTKDPRKYQGTTIAVTAGNHNQFSARIRQATKINNKWAYKITGEYVAGKEYTFYDTVYVTKYPGRDSSSPELNVNFDFRHIRGEAYIYYSVTPKTDIIVSGGGSNNNFEQVTTGGRNQMRGVTYSFIQARLINPNYFVNVYNTWGSIGTSYPIGPYTRDFWSKTHGPNPVLPETADTFAMNKNQFKEESQRLNADAQYNYDFKKAGLFLVAGLNYQKEKPNGFGKNLIDKYEKIIVTQYGGVLQTEKTLPWTLRFIAGLRFDHHSNFGDFFSPKLGLVKEIGAGSFRVTWGRAYAMPTILHQYSNLQGTTFGNGEGITYIPNESNYSDPASVQKIASLKPEQVTTLEFGYKGTIAKKLFVDINYYNGHSKNFLGTPKPILGRILSVGDIEVFPANPGTVGTDGKLHGASFTTFFNYSAVRSYGLDAGFTYSFNSFVSMSVNYSWFNSDITEDDLKNDANGDGYVSLEETSLNAPNHRGGVMLNFQNLCKGKLFANISARILQQYDFYSGSQIGTEDGKGTRGVVPGGINPATGQARYYLKNYNWGPLGGYTTFDLSAGYNINKTTSINMGVTNLFNIKQIEFVGSPSIDRLIYFELKVHIPNKTGL